MNIAIGFLLVVFSALACSAQQFAMSTGSALALVADHAFISYAFTFTPSLDTYWLPSKKSGSKEPCLAGLCEGGFEDVTLIKTDYEGSKLWLSDSHDICGPGFGPMGSCTFEGLFFLGPLVTRTKMPDGSFSYQVYGLAQGTFTDDFGESLERTAIFNFITYPTPNKKGYGIPATGSVIVELSTL